MPNCSAQARRFQKPDATQNQMAAMISDHSAGPHCAVGNVTSLPTKLKCVMPR